MHSGRRLLLLPGIALAALLTGCGGSPTAPLQTTVVAQGSDTLQAGLLVTVPFSTDGAGRVDANVDWTFASNGVDLGIFGGTCTVIDARSFSCGTPLAWAAGPAKPVTATIANAEARAYTLVIQNMGPGGESLSWQVTLTR